MNDDKMTMLTPLRLASELRDDSGLDEQTIKLLMDAVFTPDKSHSVKRQEGTVLPFSPVVRMPGEEAQEVRSGGKPLHPFQTLVSTRSDGPLTSPTITEPWLLPQLDDQMSHISPSSRKSLALQNVLRRKKPTHPFERIVLNERLAASSNEVPRVSLSPQVLRSAASDPRSFAIQTPTLTSTPDASSSTQALSSASTSTNKYHEGAIESPKPSGADQRVCFCRRSKCLKLYCGCFASGMVCDPSACGCRDCLNTETNRKEREEAINDAKSRHGDAFHNHLTRKEKRMLQSVMYRQYCHCKKSKCLKKYCNCFFLKTLCTEECGCRNCENSG